MIRVGHGFDVHKLISGDSIILCGVTIPHDKALSGHSDADRGCVTTDQKHDLHVRAALLQDRAAAQCQCQRPATNDIGKRAFRRISAGAVPIDDFNFGMI